MRIAVIGRSEILYESAKALAAAGHEIVLIVTAKEAPEYERTLEDFRELAGTLKAAFVHAPAMPPNGDAIAALRRALPIDIGVSYNYTNIIPQDVIDLFSLGILNAHGGDLPRYRGNACQAWAILNGEQRIGLCVHKMVGGELDSGDIIARDYLAIDHTTKITAVMDWMTKRIPALMMDAALALVENPKFILSRQSKNPMDIMRCYPRRPEDGRVEWGRHAIDILRLINASNKPYAGAFCEFEEKKLVIWDAELFEDNESFCALPGQITAIGLGHVVVACGTGKLRINTVELDARSQSPDLLIRSLRQRLK